MINLPQRTFCGLKYWESEREIKMSKDWNIKYLLAPVLCLMVAGLVFIGVDVVHHINN